MRTIELVSHCYRYGRVLNYQFSSLFLYPPKRCHVTLTVYHCWEDEFTKEVVRYFTGSTPGILAPVASDPRIGSPECRLISGPIASRGGSYCAVRSAETTPRR